MKCKDATSSFGNVGYLLSVLLIFLISAGAAYACPDHGSKVVYRTRTVNTVPGMRTTVITYRGPAVYARCGGTVSGMRTVKYVRSRANVYYNAVPTRYIAVRNVDSYYPSGQMRYVAVRNVERAYAPRYVSVRTQPAYVDAGTNYVLVRNDVPRTKYVAIRDADMDDVVYDRAPSYVAVRRDHAQTMPTRYVAVRDIDDDVSPASYVAARNAGCACPMTSLDPVETTSMRHVVVKSDYIAGTQEIIVPKTSYEDTAYFDDTAYVSLPRENVNRTFVSYSPAAYARTQAINYVPAYDDDDIDRSDQAILDTGGTTYVVVNDIGNACLSPVAVRASPVITSPGSVAYLPVTDVDHTLVYDDTTADMSYLPVVNAETNYVVKDSCSCPASLNTFDVPATMETVSYVPANSMSTETYVPVDDVEHVDTADTDSCECETGQNVVLTEADEFAPAATASVEDPGVEVLALTDPQQIAGDNGYRDGFEEGKQAALSVEEFRPENSEEFQQAFNVYDDTYGSKEVYNDAYRDAYLRGYAAGFDSVTGTG